jgi:hypothetical protein
MELLLFLFKSGLPDETVLDVVNSRAEQYRSVPGLIQKFYVHDTQSKHIGGVFVFDSKENLQAFWDSDLAQSTSNAYKFIEPPIVRELEITRALITNTPMIFTNN